LIVVFGAGGQVGQELTAKAARDGVRLTAIGRQTADITDRAAVARAIRDFDASLVVNAAGYTAVDKAESEPDVAKQANAGGPAVVAAACTDAGIPIIHISTDFVFDGDKGGPYREDDPVRPLGAYGLSKAEGEEAVRGTCGHHLIIRTAWLFGAYGSNFLKTILRLAAERDELNVVADQRGSPTATADLANAILTAATAVGRGNTAWGTYHFAGTGEATWYTFASYIVTAQARFTGRRPKVNPVPSTAYPTAARRPRNSVLDSSKFADVFDFRASPWQTAVDHVVAGLFDKGAAA
jgi:dTDP-4-dehydrorhamnose reductase